VSLLFLVVLEGDDGNGVVIEEEEVFATTEAETEMSSENFTFGDGDGVLLEKAFSMLRENGGALFTDRLFLDKYKLKASDTEFAVITIEEGEHSWFILLLLLLLL
jgi:hypothetical protein